jgi:transposase
MEQIMKEKVSDQDQRKFWQMAIETWQASGLSVRQFCKQEGLSEPSFYSWRKRLAKVVEPEADNRAINSAEPFIQVSLQQEKSSCMELMFSSGHMLRINPGIDNKTLTVVLSAICEAGLC